MLNSLGSRRKYSLTERKPSMTQTQYKNEEYFTGKIANVRSSYLDNINIPSRTERSHETNMADKLIGGPHGH